MELLFILIGPLMLVIGIIMLFKGREFVKKSKVISGDVIEIRKRPTSKNKTAYYPVVKYVDSLTSSEETYESNTAYESTRFKIGDRVELRYLNDGVKKKVCLNNWSGIWGLSFMLIIFGLIFCVIDFVLFFLKN